MTVQIRVYSPTQQDLSLVWELLAGARRSFLAFGREDLARMVAVGDCMVAGTEKRLWAFLCASISHTFHDPGGAETTWARLKGAAVVDGWPTDEGLEAVLSPLTGRLRRRQVSYLITYGTAPWLVPALMRAGFRRVEWIVTLERHPRPLKLGPLALATTRGASAQDLGTIAAIDREAFDPLFQFSTGDLIELLVTCGHFAVAAVEGKSVGYACANVAGEEGQIIRLAVRPDAQSAGTGRMLLNECLAYCQAAGARQVIINTQQSNQASLHLYEQFGFRQVGRRLPVLLLEL